MYQGQVTVNQQGVMEFHGPSKELMVKIYERKLAEAREEGKFSVFVNIVKAIENMANK